jgi:hypothetical protein
MNAVYIIIIIFGNLKYPYPSNIFSDRGIAEHNDSLLFCYISLSVRNVLDYIKEHERKKYK